MLFYESLADHVIDQSKKLLALEEDNIPEVSIILDVLGPNDNQDMNANPGRHSVTQQVDRLPIDCHGIAGDRHRGLAWPSTGREAPLYKQSQATIVNRRQLFAVSPYE